MTGRRSRLSSALLVLALGLVSSACSESAVLTPFPGERWLDVEGNQVEPERLAYYASDCPAWPGAGFLEIGPGLVEGFDEPRRFARDPGRGLPSVELRAPYDPRSALSRDARFTGFETDRFMVFLGDDQDLYAYVVDGPRVEALPRVEDGLACP